MDHYVIRTMTRDEVDTAVEWAAAEGWNPGQHDADSFYAADSDGFLVGLLDGQPVASISAVRSGPHYAFIGFYIVRPEYRGQGYGYRIWQAAMQRLDGRDVGLDARRDGRDALRVRPHGDPGRVRSRRRAGGPPRVGVAQIDNYKKSGFESAYLNTRYQGHAQASETVDPRIVALADVPFEQVLAYDTALMPAPRPDFLARWLRQPEAIALGLRDGDRLVGYGVLRRAREGYKVGPLFANDKDAADVLFRALTSRVPPGTVVYLDVPGEEVNTNATGLARAHGMTPVFAAARMYRMADPSMKISLPLHRWFGVTSFELG